MVFLTGSFSGIKTDIILLAASVKLDCFSDALTIDLDCESELHQRVPNTKDIAIPVVTMDSFKEGIGLIYSLHNHHKPYCRHIQKSPYPLEHH